MKNTKRLITTILALSILLSVLAGITVSALELNEDLIIEESSPEEELMPLATVYLDYPNFHALLDAQKISYTGVANGTVLEEGYRYTYTKSCSYWSIYLEGPNGPIGLFHVGSMV